MDYFRPEEIKDSQSVKARNREFVGPAVRHGFSIDVVKKWMARENLAPAELNVLDCGTASGKFFFDLKEAGFHNLYGVDIDDYLQPEAKKIAKEFKTADLSYEKLPWTDNFFNLITAWCVVPHLENPHNFIREAHRVLKPNGLLIYSAINITSPSHRNYFRMHGDLPGYHERNNHIAILTPAIFTKTVLRYFDCIGTEYFINPRIFEGMKGAIRKVLYGIAGRHPFLKEKLDQRWGPKIVYVLKKKAAVAGPSKMTDND